MAITLAQAQLLSNDTLLQGVIETVIKESPILQLLPFVEVLGNGLTDNRENAMATAAFYDVGDTWAESTPTFTQLTASLKIMGGDADVDNFLRTTRSNIQDLEATIVEMKAKAVRHKFEDTFLNGDDSADAKSFDGLDVICTGDQAIECGATGATLSLANVDNLIDLIKPGKPDLLLMSRRSRRKLKALRRAQTAAVIETEMNQFGEMVTFYDGIRVGISDWIADTTAYGGGSATSSVIYAVRFGEDGVCGISSPGLLQVERIGSLETKDASRTRIKWYASLAVFSTLAAAKLSGVQD